MYNNYLLLQGNINDLIINIHVVYAPVNGTHRPLFFQTLPRDFPESQLHIVLGDFNTVLSAELDQIISTNRSRLQGRQDLSDWMLDLNLVDAWRLQNPKGLEYTSPNQRSRIDMILLSTTIFTKYLQNILHIYSSNMMGADHNGITVHLATTIIANQEQAPWKCPEWVIKTAEAQKYLYSSLQTLANRIRVGQDTNPGCLLDENKRSDRIFLRRLFVKITTTRKLEIERLHLKSAALQKKYNITKTATIESELRNTKILLASMVEEEKVLASESKFRSDIDQSEKCTKYFFRSPQIYFKTAIPIESVQDLKTKRIQFNEYWSGVFHSPSREYSHPQAKWDPTKLALLLKHSTRYLTLGQQRYLDSPFTANDFYYALKYTGKNKTPGPDGLPLQYYLTDINLWSQILVTVYSEQLYKGRMTKFQRRGQISLLFKKGNRHNPSNYRPITLLNTDAKLGPKILAKRLNSILPSIIHPDQHGFVPGRDIRHIHLKLQAFQHIYSKLPTPAGAILLDFAKAFDNVVWDALDMVFLHFNFGNIFRRWVRVFFKDTLVSILFNGAPLPPFQLGSGVRQGDPLSPALFIIFIEPLLNYLRDGLTSLGLICNGQITRCSVVSFADDCTGLLHDLHHAPTFLNMVENFCKASGMKLNKSKTVIYPFKDILTSELNNATILMKRLEELDVKILSNQETTKLLGIYYGPTVTDLNRLLHIIPEIQLRCTLWKYRARTLNGRCVILQQIILPTLWYTASTCYVPKSTFQEQINKLITSFLTQGKKTNILPITWRNIEKSKGGLGLNSLEDSIDGLQVHMLVNVIKSVRKSNGSQEWTLPISQLFDEAIAPWGASFDILYAPVTTTPHFVNARNQKKWSQLTTFWHHVLYIWHTKLRKNLKITSDNFERLQIPFLYNYSITQGKLKRPLAYRPTNLIRILGQNEIFTANQIISHFGNPPDSRVMADYLRVRTEGTCTSIFACQNFLKRLQPLLENLNDYPIGPQKSQFHFSANRGWYFENYEINDLKVHHIVKMISVKLQPDLPIQKLAIEKQPPSDIWARDRKMNVHILPVQADFLYHVQHNALYLGYRFQHTELISSQCGFGCNVPETAPHLLFYCTFASEIWNIYLPIFQPLLISKIEWPTILYFTDIKPTESTKKKMGYGFFLIFHIVRTTILRQLWTHRNDIRFYDVTLNTTAVQSQIKSLIVMHIRRLWNRLSTNIIRHSKTLQNQLRITIPLLQLPMLLTLPGFQPSESEELPITLGLQTPNPPQPPIP